MRKEVKNEKELEDILMAQISENPEYSNVTGVAIKRIPRNADHHSNWDADFNRDGQRTHSGKCDEIKNKLRGKYDISD